MHRGSCACPASELRPAWLGLGYIVNGSQLGGCSRSFGEHSAVQIMPERGIYERSVNVVVYFMPASTRDVSIVARKLEAERFKVHERGPDAESSATTKKYFVFRMLLVSVCRSTNLFTCKFPVSSMHPISHSILYE